MGQMTASIERAATFVAQRGADADLARLHHLRMGTPLSAEVATTLLSGQREDSGWAPFWASGYSSLDATCFHLAQAEQAGIALAHPSIQQAAHFLVRRQEADGSWEEDVSEQDIAPPWARPGDMAARLYLTANCAFWLAMVLPDSTYSGSASTFLGAHLDATGALPSFLQTHWLSAGLWYRLGDAERARRVLAYLSDRMDERLPASSLSWMLTTLLLAGVPATDSLVRRGALLLEREQRSDGGWPSEDGPSREVHVTLEALRVLKLCGQLS